VTGSAIPDAIALEVFRHLFTALAEEMGAALKRASFSPNIKERRDYSCALFSPDGAAVSLGDHMPVHLGAMPMSVWAALEELGRLAPGDVACLNDPFRGGTHLPDITLLAPVYQDDERLLGYVASRAHHSDVGGSTPGSMPLAREIYEEGRRAMKTCGERFSRMCARRLSAQATWTPSSPHSTAVRLGYGRSRSAGGSTRRYRRWTR
jgi:N-methylhydantoinase B/oxoprolinase/acetone carboxylase alpha subunit